MTFPSVPLDAWTPCGRTCNGGGNHRTVRVGKKHWKLDALIGCRFGSTFEGRPKEEGGKQQALIEMDAERAQRRAAGDEAVAAGNDDDGEGNDEDDDGGCQNDDKVEDAVADRDNRNLVDTNTAQGLEHEKITDMKRDVGVTGHDIVDALVKNSKTFGDKTVYSQEKYRRKKEKKYVTIISVHRPTIASVTNAFTIKARGHHDSRISGLRLDSLSLLLNVANVCERARCLVVDGTGGLVTAAALDRTGGIGDGLVCVGYCGTSSPSLEVVNMFNFESRHYDRVFRAPFNDLDEFPEKRKTERWPKAKSNGGHGARQSIRRLNYADWRAVTERGFSSLVVADPVLDPVEVYRRCRRYLAPSASMCFFSNAMQPLAELMHGMTRNPSSSSSSLSTSPPAPPPSRADAANDRAEGRKCGGAVNVQLFEPWTREYQVLPMRTHPRMNMLATGGYLLSATYVGDDIFVEREKKRAVPSDGDGAPQKKPRVDGACEGDDEGEKIDADANIVSQEAEDVGAEKDGAGQMDVGR